MTTRQELPRGTSIFVGNGRTALKIAIRQLDLAKGERVLLPEFVCDVLLHPIGQSGLIPVYFPITEHLSPDWESLEALAERSRCRALVMIHYFGQPQDIDRFRHFCCRHGMFLIEDNAHGYSGCVAGEPLGSFGDVGISSPRKFLGTPSGGALTGASELAIESAGKLRAFPAYLPNHVVRTTMHSFTPAWRLLKSLSARTNDWSDPRLFQETVKPDFGIDWFSLWRIHSADWKLIAKQRRSNWSAWAGFAASKGLRPVFNEVHPDSCPWSLPVWTKDLSERNAWLSWSADNRTPFFSWPVLPANVISSNGNALALWKRLLCFPLDVAPRTSDK